MVVHAGPGTAGAPRPGDRRRAADGCDARLDQPGQITREPAAEPGSAQPTQPGMVAASRWPAIQKRGQGQVHDASLCVAQLIRPHFAGRRALASSAQQWLPDRCGRRAERPGGRDGRVLPLHRVRAQGPAGRVLGIAYLFVAFGSAEFIHASNFGRIFARLNVEVAPIQKPEFKVGSTRENLLVAANTFLGSVQPSCGRRYRVLGPDKPSSGAHGAQRRTCWTTRCCTGGLRSPTRERSRPLSTFGRGPSKAWVHLTLSPSSRCHRALQPVEWAWLAGNPLRSKS